MTRVSDLTQGLLCFFKIYSQSNTYTPRNDFLLNRRFGKNMASKIFFSFVGIENIVRDCAQRISDSEADPEVIIAISGGGLVPARFFRNHLAIPIFTVCIKFYDDEKDTRVGTEPEILQWLDANALERIKGKRVLIVDDLCDSGFTLKCCVKEVSRTCEPKNISIAVVHHKNVIFQEEIENIPEVDYYFPGQSMGDAWIVYPWEMKEEEDSISDGECEEEYSPTPEMVGSGCVIH